MRPYNIFICADEVMFCSDNNNQEIKEQNSYQQQHDNKTNNSNTLINNHCDDCDYFRIVCPSSFFNLLFFSCLSVIPIICFVQ